MKKPVPDLRFSEFSDKWKEKNLGFLYDFKSTNSYSRDQLSYEVGKVYNIHYGDIHRKFKSQFRLDSEEVPYIDPKVSLQGITEDKYCLECDVVFADASEDYNDIGKAVELIELNQKKVLAGLHTLLARSKKVLKKGFGGYLMASPNVRKQIKVIAQGTKVLGVSAKELKKVSLIYPKSENEQKKIAAFLGTVDQKITQLQKKRDLLEKYKVGCTQQLFSQQIRFTNDNGNSFPDWEESEMSAVFEEGTERADPDAELLSVTIDKGIIKSSELGRVVTTSADRSNYKRVKIGDIAYNSMRMWQGASGVSAYNGIVSPAYTVARPKQNQNSKFWGYYFKIKKNVHKFERFSQGLTSDTWNLKFPAFAKIVMEYPHPDEQQKIADFLSAIDDKIVLVDKELNKAKLFKKGLLQQMFV